MIYYKLYRFVDGNPRWVIEDISPVDLWNGKYSSLRYEKV